MINPLPHEHVIDQPEPTTTCWDKAFVLSALFFPLIVTIPLGLCLWCTACDPVYQPYCPNNYQTNAFIDRIYTSSVICDKGGSNICQLTVASTHYSWDGVYKTCDLTVDDNRYSVNQTVPIYISKTNYDCLDTNKLRNQAILSVYLMVSGVVLQVLLWLFFYIKGYIVM